MPFHKALARRSYLFGGILTGYRRSVALVDATLADFTHMALFWIWGTPRVPTSTTAICTSSHTFK